MSKLGETSLIGLLTDLESIEFLAREGLNPEVIPTESLRLVFLYALNYYRDSVKAPTPGVLKAQFGDLLSDHEIDIDATPEEDIAWAVDDLNSSYVRNQGGQFSRRLVTEITSADPQDRVDVLAEFSNELSSIVMSLQPRTSQVDMRTSADRIITAYEDAYLNQGQIKGLAFGLAQIDSYTGGIHPGEMAVVAGAAKSGKSWFLDFVAYHEWERGNCPALFTMENSIEMTEMRIACIALHISITEMMDGRLSDADYMLLVTWCKDVLEVAPNPLYIFNPALVNRTPQAVVQAARANNADSIILDQLTFMESTRKRREQNRSYEIRDILVDLKGMVSTGRNRLPVLMAHQLKRDGVKSAEKTGRFVMTDMADSADVERTLDFSFALYASDDMRELQQMEFQGLAARRKPLRDFDMVWNIDIGVVAVRNDVPIPVPAA